MNPWFERWVTVRFRTEIAVSKGSLHIAVRLPQGSAGRYLAFGTADRAVDRPEVQAQFRYVENWYATNDSLRVFENPANIDYGAKTPTYAGGTLFDAAGRPVHAIDLAFQVFGANGPVDECAERFAFVNDITSPVSASFLRFSDAPAGEGEIRIDSSWHVDASGGGAVQTAAKEMREFLSRGMGVTLQHGGRKTISARVCDAGTTTAESFRMTIRPDRIDICGSDERAR